MASEETNVIPIIKLSNNTGPYYPLSVPEAVYSTHSYQVLHNIGTYKKNDIIDPLTTLDTIITNILGDQGNIRYTNFVGVAVTNPGDNDGWPEAITLDNKTVYKRDQYTEGDILIYNTDSSNVLCIFYKKSTAEHGKWLLISDDILYVGDEDHPPAESSKKKVLWLDTTTKPIDTYTDTPQMESLKNMIYKLMMAYGKVVKLVENGVKPTDAGGVISGTEVNNWRRELIAAAEPEEPVDVISSNTLENISIYGNDYTGNGSVYRAVFTPNGFTDKRVRWEFTTTYSENKKIIGLESNDPEDDGKIIARAEIHATTATKETEEGIIIEKPECSLELYMWDEERPTEKGIIDYTKIKDTPIELNAIYDIGDHSGSNKIVGTKTIKVGGEKPETDVEPTVKAICIKMDTSENFANNKDNLIDGELLFYTDKAKFAIYRCFKNSKDVWIEKFYTLQSNESEQQGLTEEQLYQLALKYLQFKDNDGNVYKVYINSDGQWKLKLSDSSYPINASDGGYAGGGTGSRYVSMGAIYCGGDISNQGKVSHNFVEIYNSSLTGNDYNLSGAFLLYTDGTKWSDGTGYIWQKLQLSGVVKAGSTFTVRGARCNKDDACFIKIDKYDQEWYDDYGDLIEFDINKGTFYLVNGETVDGRRTLPSKIEEAINKHEFTGFSSTTLELGYIDGFGFKNINDDNIKIPAEKQVLLISPTSVTTSEDLNKVTADQCIFTKNFILDPSKQALKAYDSKNTTTLWTFINFNKQTQKLGNSIQYYWPDSYKKSYQPGSVEDKHDFYSYGRTKFDPKQPNAINITFGKQATATVKYAGKVDNGGVTYYIITDNDDLRNDAVKYHTFDEDFKYTTTVSNVKYTDNINYAKDTTIVRNEGSDKIYYHITDDETLKEKAVKTHAFNESFGTVSSASDAIYTDHIKYAKHTVNSDASRCFNWVSVGNFDEYVEYRKKGTDTWIRQYSIIEKDNTDSDSMIYDTTDPKNPRYIDAPFIEFYKRFSWPTGYDNIWVTTHKRIIRNLTSGTYEYRIGRDNDSSYLSQTKEFLIKNDTQVTDFRFTQVTDQQGFNWAEYQAWKRACYMINKNGKEGITNTGKITEVAKDFDFTINTGDIGQSGNRVSEFLDYFNGRDPISDRIEMFSIGNNDLCSRNPTTFGNGEDFDSKYNHINVRKYYTFELDPNNVDDNGDSNYYIPSIEIPMDVDKLKSKTFYNIPIDSVYSFNYGNYHFVSLNSEYNSAFATMYNKIDYKTSTQCEESGAGIIAKTINERLEKWLTNDLLIWKPESYYSTNDSKYMYSKKYYWYKNEFGEVSDTIMQLQSGVNYKQGASKEKPSEGADSVGTVKVKDKSHPEEYKTITVSSTEIYNFEPRNCSKCLVYMHEIPFTIVTDDFINSSTTERGGSKLNTYNNMGSYRFSRLFNKYGIRIIFGGHKHTYSMSRPLFDASGMYLSKGLISPLYTDNVAGTEVTTLLSRQPVVQFINIGNYDSIANANTARGSKTYVAIHLVKDDPTAKYTAGTYLYTDQWTQLVEETVEDKIYYKLVYGLITIRCDLVDKITAPTYVMSQATGFKLVSNKELMTNIIDIPWMLTSCPQKSEKKAGRNQLDPMYITYDFDSDTNKVIIKMKVVKNIFDITEKSGAYNAVCTLNTQKPQLENSILFEQTLENI